MLVAIFNNQGIIHKEFVSPGQMVNKEYYVEVLSCFVQRIRRLRRPQFHERGNYFLLHDNARPHTAVSTKQLLTKQGIPETNHPHILHIYPQQTFLIPQIKSSLKGRRFEDSENIKRNVTK
jgi:hypothetical protein